MRYGLIAGNGRFPLLALESARRLGHDVTVVAIQEEASAEVAAAAPRCHWISLGQLSKLIDILKQEGITEVAAGEAAGHAALEEYRRADRRRDPHPGGRGHSPAGFDRFAKADARGCGRDDAAQAN
jgi:DUF1009 family protein